MSAVSSTSTRATGKREPPSWLVNPSQSPAKRAPRDAPESPAAVREAKRAQARRLRQLFCKDGMLLDNGDLNPDYFKPKFSDEEERNWGTTEKKLLLVGIEQHGIGAWDKIRKQLLPRWTNNELRVKASRLVGRQNLKPYVGWKANATMLDVERQRNKTIADEVKREHGLERWKGNVLVADDSGHVDRAVEASELVQPRAKSL